MFDRQKAEVLGRIALALVNLRADLTQAIEQEYAENVARITDDQPSDHKAMLLAEATGHRDACIESADVALCDTLRDEADRLQSGDTYPPHRYVDAYRNHLRGVGVVGLLLANVDTTIRWQAARLPVTVRPNYIPSQEVPL